MLVLLLSVLFQGYVAQTHIHGSGHLSPGISAPTLFAAGEVAQNPASPTDDDHTDCLLCQAVLHAGAVALPSLMAVQLPALLVVGLLEAEPSPASRAFLSSHGWQSRAPPRS